MCLRYEGDCGGLGVGERVRLVGEDGVGADRVGLE